MKHGIFLKLAMLMFSGILPAAAQQNTIQGVNATAAQAIASQIATQAATEQAAALAAPTAKPAVQAATAAGTVKPMMPKQLNPLQSLQNAATKNRVQATLPSNTVQTVRIKDATRLKGYESYDLVGYGLVVGLNDTGDSDKILVQQTIANMMQNFNIVVDPKELKANNTAAVMVTVTIRGNRKKGDMISGSISAIGDCSSLTGGVLIMTPLLGGDGEVWAMAQGPVTTGAYTFGGKGGGGDQVTKNHPTAGMLTNGVKLLKDFGPDYNNEEIITLILNQPDYTSAVNLTQAVNNKYAGVATALDSATVQVRIPNQYRDENNVSSFISEVGLLYFATDNIAKVVFNERTGTIVIGHNVRISNAAVSHGNLFVRVKSTESVSQPTALSQGGTSQRMTDQQTTSDEEKARMFELQNTTTVGDLVNALNNLGVGSRDIMVIFHVLKAAGALHAELEAI